MAKNFDLTFSVIESNNGQIFGAYAPGLIYPDARDCGFVYFFEKIKLRICNLELDKLFNDDV